MAITMRNISMWRADVMAKEALLDYLCGMIDDPTAWDHTSIACLVKMIVDTENLRYDTAPLAAMILANDSQSHPDHFDVRVTANSGYKKCLHLC
jgi:hypothetical protein